MPAKLNTRDRVVFAAMELFGEKGFQSTSVADILSRSKVNAGSLYYYFPGKQDVLLAVLETYCAGIGPMLLEPAWNSVHDPIERVFALLARYRELIVQTNNTYGCPIGSLALELHEPDPAVRELLSKNFSAWVSAVEKCLSASGLRLPKGTNAKKLAIFTLTTMEGGVMLARTYRDPKYFDDAVSQLKNYYKSIFASK